MLQLPTKKISAIVGWSALIAAFSICLGVIALSWPNPRERNRPMEPQLAGCCHADVEKVIFVSGSAEAKRRNGL
jgi:hypothetical protein